MPKNVYIHIPFCKSKCKYCSFVSFPKLEQKAQYINALVEEIQTKYNGELLNTLYFGGFRWGNGMLIDHEMLVA